jgi:type II secretory pathway pseudopilin PulG
MKPRRITARGSSAAAGYTYIAVLMMLAVIALASALTLEVADTNARRSGEAELVSMGHEFERAFASYYRQSPAGSRPYPERLEDLARDPRMAGVRRHLRKVYPDPLTGEAWGTVPAPGGGIMAVYSTAKGQPLRESAGVLSVMPAASVPIGLVAATEAGTAGPATARAQSYAEWKFGYDPATDRRSRMDFIVPSVGSQVPRQGVSPSFPPPMPPP